MSAHTWVFIEECTELGRSPLPAEGIYSVEVLEALQGKGLGYGAVADFVHSIKIVDGAGNVVEYDATHPLFDQSRCA